MKILHTADLHIGKKLNGYILSEDQIYILKQITDIAESEKVDAVVIAGDIYDRSQAAGEAVAIFDKFITDLKHIGTNVYVVNGNHDSRERISYGSGIFSKSGIFMNGGYGIKKYVAQDEYGKINIYMLPYLSCYNVEIDGKQAESTAAAVEYAIKSANIDIAERNIVVAHQFVTDGENLPDFSEEEHIMSRLMTVGGSEAVESRVFEDFDYVALGHIHSSQKIGKKGEIYYSGAPLKYSFSKEKNQKSVIIAEIKEKGNVSVKKVPLRPLREMIIVNGTFDEIINGSPSDDYIKVEITSNEEVINLYERIKNVYKNLMKMNYTNRNTKDVTMLSYEDPENKSEGELFGEFYKKINGCEISEDAAKIIEKLFLEIKGED